MCSNRPNFHEVFTSAKDSFVNEKVCISNIARWTVLHVCRAKLCPWFCVQCLVRFFVMCVYIESACLYDLQQVGVFFCGPPGLGEMVTECDNCSDKHGTRFKFREEHF